jgi:alpha-beta hydrolase superfamily lysophospholipase
VKKTLLAVALVTTALLTAGAPAASADPVVGVDMSCLAPAGNPAPGSPEWQQRDTQNQYCATLRLRDQFLSPAFGFGNTTQGAQLWVDQATQQAGEPSHVHGGTTTLIPGSQSADPFRTLRRWVDAGRGTVTAVRFNALDGAQLRGHVFLPPASVPKPPGGYPGVVITDGSIQAFENLYFWAAEDLAEAGYEVMTYDVQGQGDSDLFPANCPDPSNPSPSCQGVPYQQNYNFFQGAEDSLNFFLSSPEQPYTGGVYNPSIRDLDTNRVAVAGHSLGAAAVSDVGQCDNRVKAVVAWDNLSKITDCSGVTIDPQYQSADLIHAPALALTNDYAFNPQPMSSPPNPHAKDAGYNQVAAAGEDAQIVAFRNATHLTYSYIPAVLPANELSERMASYYTTAFLDLELKGDPSGYQRLTADKFDDSADVHSIGAGIFDATAHDPADPYSGNIPYKIAGISVPDAVSFYYLSEYSLRDPQSGALTTCDDMRSGCTGPPRQLPPVEGSPPGAGAGSPGQPGPAAAGATNRLQPKAAKCNHRKKGCTKKR